MADNVIIDLMSDGSTVATDNVADIHHQLVKVEYGTDGAATMVSASNPLPVSGISGTTSVNTPGTITSGSISVIAGTVASVGTIPGIGVVTNITNGTIQNSGTVTGVGVVSQITTGSIVITAGTVTTGAGTQAVTGDIASGTTDSGNPVKVGAVFQGTAGTVTNGQRTNLQSDNVGNLKVYLATTLSSAIDSIAAIGTVSVNTPGTITSGSIAVTAGTVTLASPGTITSGTVSINAGTVIVTAGTINSGTINAGTIKNDGRPARNILSFGTTVTLAGTAYGTIIGSAVVGAGTSIWINDISLVNSGVGTSTFGMGFGTWMAGSAVLVRGKFAPNSGIQKSFPMPVNCGMTNYDLNVFTADAAGTVGVNVSYFISA